MTTSRANGERCPNDRSSPREYCVLRHSGTTSVRDGPTVNGQSCSVNCVDDKGDRCRILEIFRIVE